MTMGQRVDDIHKRLALLQDSQFRKTGGQWDQRQTVDSALPEFSYVRSYFQRPEHKYQHKFVDGIFDMFKLTFVGAPEAISLCSLNQLTQF